MTTPLRAALHSHATGILDRRGIDEPLTWEPPAACCGQLELPGRDPAGIGSDEVQQLVSVQQLPVGLAARRLATSSFHIRYALESVPRPARPWGPAPRPPPGLPGRRPSRLRQIADETGFARPLVAEHAHRAGISLASSPPPAAIDGD